jgi:hypothetical protein
MPTSKTPTRVTCTTTGCGNAGVTIDLRDALDALDAPPDSVLCGVCGTALDLE